MERGSGASHINNMIFALRKFLAYCQEIHKLDTVNPKDLRAMKPPRREVQFLKPEEITGLLNSIQINGIRGLRMRTLVEVLLCTECGFPKHYR